jgi:hypothetical protein
LSAACLLAYAGYNYIMLDEMKKDVHNRNLMIAYGRNKLNISKNFFT